MSRPLAPVELEAAGKVMAEATSYFVQQPYGEEAIVALQQAGWTITPPASPGAGGRNAELRPMAELSATGVLWLINRVVFHPRGFALALKVSDCGDVDGWTMQGDGTEPFVMPYEVDDEKFAAVEALLDEYRERNG